MWPPFDSWVEKIPWRRIGYPLQYTWACLEAQTVKNLPAMRETWVWSLGWEDPLEEGMATHSSILAWKIPVDRRAWWATVMGLQRVRHDWATKHKDKQRKFFRCLLHLKFIWRFVCCVCLCVCINRNRFFQKEYI